VRGAGGKYTLRADAYEVRLNASVFDGGGRSIQTLDRDAFQVYEDGIQQTIASFRHEDLPVSLEKTSDSAMENVDSVEIALAIVLLTGAGLMLKLAVGRQSGPIHRNRPGREPWSSSGRGCHRKDPRGCGMSSMESRKQ